MAEIKIGRNARRITLSFPYNPALIAKIKSIEGYKWHSEGKYWSVPYSKAENLLSVFDGEDVDIEPAVYFGSLRKELASRKYSRRTIKAYLHYNEDFLRFSRKAPYEISNDDLRDYLYHLAEKKDASASTLNIAINALKFYYGETLKPAFFF